MKNKAYGNWCKELRDTWQADGIRSEVQDTMAQSMEGFDFHQIIEHSNLTTKQKTWAKKNLDWKVVTL